MIMQSEHKAAPIDLSVFINNFRQTLKSVFYERDNIEKFIQKRGFPALVLRDIMAQNPLSVAIPEVYGGRGCKVKECLAILEASSYESLPLSLMFGINIALFLEPVAKYGQEDIKPEIFNRFLHRKNMGGLMITEPDFGSDALGMQTFYEKKGDQYHIKGVKHWQGLTGMADYWLMTCRKKTESGTLSREIEFFICDEQKVKQRIVVDELYNNIALYPIPYGKNIIDIVVPERNRLIPHTSGLKLMMDILHRSRAQFPGMAMGFIRRMLDEALEQTSNRIVGGKPLLELDQVKYQVSNIQSAFTICSAMCHRSSKFSSIENDLAGDAVEANSMKAYVTDLMQYSSQTLTQLCGANGYKSEHIGARGILDSRPFRIFEGSNEMLYTQNAEMVIKQMGRKKIQNLSAFLTAYSPTAKAAPLFKESIDFSPSDNLSQRKLVDLGKIISRVVAANQVVELGESGFRKDLIDSALNTIKHRIKVTLQSYQNHSEIMPIADYEDSANWLSFS